MSASASFSKKPYRKPFDPKWINTEEHQHYRFWIEKVPDDIYRIYCKICNREIFANHMTEHENTYYHQQQSVKYKINQ